jgi:hypothetical protein
MTTKMQDALTHNPATGEYWNWCEDAACPFWYDDEPITKASVKHIKALGFEVSAFCRGLADEKKRTVVLLEDKPVYLGSFQYRDWSKAEVGDSEDECDSDESEKDSSIKKGDYAKSGSSCSCAEFVAKHGGEAGCSECKTFGDPVRLPPGLIVIQGTVTPEDLAGFTEAWKKMRSSRI